MPADKSGVSMNTAALLIDNGILSVSKMPLPGDIVLLPADTASLSSGKAVLPVGMASMSVGK